MNKIKTSEPKPLWKLRCTLGEGTLWVSEHNSIYFVDIKKKKIVDPVQWRDSDKYFPFLDKWINRKEYSRYIKREP